MATRATLLGGTIINTIMRQLKLAVRVETLGAALVLDAKDPPIQVLDPGGATRTVTLPAEAVSKGLVFIIKNTAGAAEDLTVQDDTPTTVATVGGLAVETGIFFCDGSAWHGLVGIP